MLALKRVGLPTHVGKRSRCVYFKQKYAKKGCFQLDFICIFIMTIYMLIVGLSIGEKVSES